MALRRIVWSDEALDDIDRLDAFLRVKSPAAADRAYLVILDAVDRLAEFPALGHPAPDRPAVYRELPVPFATGGYLVLYVDGVNVYILAVRHMREAGY